MLETTLCLTLQVRKIDHFLFSETGKHIVRGLQSRCNLMFAGLTDHANFFDFLFVDFNICSSSTMFQCNYSLVQQGFSFLSAASIHTLPHKCLPHVNILQFQVYLQPFALQKCFMLKIQRACQFSWGSAPGKLHPSTTCFFHVPYSKV